MLVERIPQHIVTDEGRRDLLRFARLGDKVDIALYTSGRIFDKDFELRWEKRVRRDTALSILEKCLRLRYQD